MEQLSPCATASEALAPRACAPQQEKPQQRGAQVTITSSLFTATREKLAQQWRSSTAKRKIIDEYRNGPGSLMAPLQEAGYLWRYQESNAGCEESRGESDSGLDGSWDCQGGRENEEPRETLRKEWKGYIGAEGKESGVVPEKFASGTFHLHQRLLAMSSDLQASWETSVCISHDWSSFLY